MVKKVIRGGVLAGFVILSFLVNNNVFADGNTTDFSITVNPSLSLSVSSTTVGFELTPSKSGSYDSASFNVYASTNNATGYTLTMSTDKVDLESNTINPNTGSKPTIPTLAETTDGISASAFENTTDANVLNHYGVSIKNANYNAMKTTQEIEKTTINNVTEDIIAVSLASKLNLLTVPGVYSTTLNFQLVANPTTPTVPYMDPDPDPTKPTVHPCAKMGDLQCEDTDDDGIEDSLVFPANSLLRTYEIAYTNAGKPMYVEDANTDIGWRPMTAADETTIGGKEVCFAIQDISMTLDGTEYSDKVCEAAASSTADNSYIDIAEVMDLRDGTSYHIVKAADNRCWMADNLALDPTDSSTASRMSPQNTNATEEAVYNYLNGGNMDEIQGWSYNAVSNEESFLENNFGWNQPFIDNRYKDITYIDSFDTDGSWRTGVFYNYCSASIGTYCYDRGVGALDGPIYDVCPIGWRLPTATHNIVTDSGEWGIIKNVYSGTIRSVLRLPLAGYRRITSLDYAGNLGYFWASSIYNSLTAWQYSVSNTENTASTYRYEGLSIRCITK